MPIILPRNKLLCVSEIPASPPDPTATPDGLGNYGYAIIQPYVAPQSPATNNDYMFRVSLNYGSFGTHTNVYSIRLHLHAVPTAGGNFNNYAISIMDTSGGVGNTNAGELFSGRKQADSWHTVAHAASDLGFYNTYAPIDDSTQTPFWNLGERDGCEISYVGDTATYFPCGWTVLPRIVLPSAIGAAGCKSLPVPPFSLKSFMGGVAGSGAPPAAVSDYVKWKKEVPISGLPVTDHASADTLWPILGPYYDLASDSMFGGRDTKLDQLWHFVLGGRPPRGVSTTTVRDLRVGKTSS